MTRRQRGDSGYAMAALLVALSVMGLMLSVALPVWQTWARREREAELVFRGEQYVQAISLFSRQTGGFPPSMNALRDGKYIRRLYKDPITNEDFQPVYLGQIAAGAVGMPGAPAAGRGAPPGRGQQPIGGRGAQGAGPIIGVASRSTAESLRQYNGRGRYNEWVFVSTAATQQAGTGGRGTQAPGADGRQGAPGRRGLPGGRQTGPPRGGFGQPPMFPGRQQGPSQPGRGRL